MVCLFKYAEIYSCYYSLSVFSACDCQSGVRCAGAPSASLQLQSVLQSRLFKGTPSSGTRVLLVVFFSRESWQSRKGTRGIETKEKKKVFVCLFFVLAQKLYFGKQREMYFIAWQCLQRPQGGYQRLFGVMWGHSEDWDPQCEARIPAIPPDRPLPEIRASPFPAEIPRRAYVSFSSKSIQTSRGCYLRHWEALSLLLLLCF